MAKKITKKPNSSGRPAKALVSQNNLTAKLKALNPAKVYAVFCVFVLGLSTLLWSILGAKLQQANADQLVNSLLFENSKTLHNATLPGAHSFLIKWPLFFVIKLLGYSSFSFISLTVLAVLATISALVFIIYKIERRPIFFGTICLALASVLLLVPAQPYAGALLPVNMAMLATRNLEYVVYIAAVLVLVKSAGSRNRWFWLCAIIMGLLVASDRLFLGISLVGAVFGLGLYSIKKKWDTATLFSGWLSASALGAIAGIMLVAAINAGGFINISSNSSGGPYSAISGGANLVLGILYSGLGVLTNFGANPAYDATVVRTIPHHIYSGLAGFGGLGYIVNLAILAFCLYTAFRLLKSSLANKKSKPLDLDKYASLGLVLLFSSLAATALFISTSHYYAVDARYLTIVLFSLFICGALFIRNRNWKLKYIVAAGAVLVISISLGIVASIQTYNKQSASLAVMKTRNALVTQALKNHPVSVLAGDYWRVIPARESSGNKLKVMPLASCTTPRNELTSAAWQPDLRKNSFAYLLSLDGSLTDYPHCNLSQVLSSYGRPNSSILIAGTFSKPKELLLVYDHGIHLVPAKSGTLASPPGTVLPIDLAELSGTSCKGPTDMNIVAHQDDDLLFMNPDLMHDVHAGHCIRTIYLTAGDAGFEKYYWLARETGTENAYSHMLGKKLVWVERIVKISSNQYITIANPRGNNSISIIFVHLPDGGLYGDGYASTRFESLQKLDSGQLQTIHSIDRQSQYNSSDLTSLLSSLMHLYQPTIIRTQSNYTGSQYPDHSDHMATGRITQKAYAEYEAQQFEGQVSIPIKFYIGYPVHEMPENISDGELEAKRDVFLDYAHYDGGVCQTIEQCLGTPTYGAYLSRQYQNPF